MMIRAITDEGYLKQWTTESINYRNNIWQNFSVTWEEGKLPRLFFQGNG